MIGFPYFSKRLWTLLISMSVALLALMVLLPQTLRAAPQAPSTFVVSRTDDGPNDFGCGAAGLACTLRGAIGYANTHPGSIIQLVHGSTYVLTNTAAGQLIVSADMTITTDLICIGMFPCQLQSKAIPAGTRASSKSMAAHTWSWRI